MPVLYNGMSVREAEPARPRNSLKSQSLTLICASRHQEMTDLIRFICRQRFDGTRTSTVNSLAASFVFERELTDLSEGTKTVSEDEGMN